MENLKEYDLKGSENY